MALAGYYIRYFGGRWGAVLQVTFLFGAAMLLVAMLFSGTLRSRLKVFLSKHFFSYATTIGKSGCALPARCPRDEPGLRERSIQAIAELVDSPGGALWLGPNRGVSSRSRTGTCPPVRSSEPAGSRSPASWRASNG